MVLPWRNDYFYKIDVVATDPNNQKKVIDFEVPKRRTIRKKHEKSCLKSCCFLISNFEGFGVENDFILVPFGVSQKRAPLDFWS